MFRELVYGRFLDAFEATARAALAARRDAKIGIFFDGNFDPTNAVNHDRRGENGRRAYGMPEPVSGDVRDEGGGDGQGYMRYSMRGNAIVSRTCSSPQIHATQRSIPMPNPPCGTVPYLRKSMYQLNASRGSPCSSMRRSSNSGS